MPNSRVGAHGALASGADRRRVGRVGRVRAVRGDGQHLHGIRRQLTTEAGPGSMWTIFWT